jgi:hypothetical protein
MQWGWTVTKMVTPYTHQGGTLDGLSAMAPCLAGAQAGEVWCVRVEPEPPFMYGAAKEAHRSCDAVARRFAAGYRFDGLTHCPCD